MYQSDFNYEHQGETCRGFVAYDTSIDKPRAAVLVVHDWSGRNEFACQHALELAKKGYVGFAVDMYGEGRIGKTIEEKQALMMPLVNDRKLLVSRLQSALSALVNMAEVDENNIGAIGFCFGGLCVLDLARSGAKVNGVVSIHGLLNAPEHESGKAIYAKVLALHGYDDPMVEPAAVQNFCQEMTGKQVDWQVHMYGDTKHAFTNPLANDVQLGTVYNEVSAKRAYDAMYHFLSECV